MAVNKLEVYAVIRSSPQPLTMPGLMALLHRQLGSRDALHLFIDIEQTSVEHALDELVSEGKVTCKFVESAVYGIPEPE